MEVGQGDHGEPCLMVPDSCKELGEMLLYVLGGLIALLIILNVFKLIFSKLRSYWRIGAKRTQPAGTHKASSSSEEALQWLKACWHRMSGTSIRKTKDGHYRFKYTIEPVKLTVEGHSKKKAHVEEGVHGNFTRHSAKHHTANRSHHTERHSVSSRYNTDDEKASLRNYRQISGGHHYRHYGRQEQHTPRLDEAGSSVFAYQDRRPRSGSPASHKGVTSGLGSTHSYSSSGSQIVEPRPRRVVVYRELRGHSRSRSPPTRSRKKYPKKKLPQPSDSRRQDYMPHSGPVYGAEDSVFSTNPTRKHRHQSPQPPERPLTPEMRKSSSTANRSNLASANHPATPEPIRKGTPQQYLSTADSLRSPEPSASQRPETLKQQLHSSESAQYEKLIKNQATSKSGQSTSSHGASLGPMNTPKMPVTGYIGDLRKPQPLYVNDIDEGQGLGRVIYDARNKKDRSIPPGEKVKDQSKVEPLPSKGENGKIGQGKIYRYNDDNTEWQKTGVPKPGLPPPINAPRRYQR